VRGSALHVGGRDDQIEHAFRPWIQIDFPTNPLESGFGLLDVCSPPGSGIQNKDASGR
jgi:hypothetical protein